jgi:carnitine-CoA ligase
MSELVTLPELIRRTATREPDRILVEQVGGPSWTYQGFYRESCRWFGGFAGIGLGPGDRVVSMFETGPEALACWIGLAWANVTEVPINTEYRGGMLRDLVRRAAPRMVVISASYVERFREIADVLVSVTAVVVTGQAADVDFGAVPVMGSDDFLAEAVPEAAPQIWDTASIMFTSGTTGASKGVIVPWGEVAQAATANFHGEKYGDTPDGAYYVPWPLYNMLGQGAFDTAVRLGLRIVLRRRFSRTEFWTDIATHRCTHVILPFIVPWLLAAPASPDDDDNTLRRAVVAPLTEDTATFAERFGVTVSGAWASTEAGFPLTAVGETVKPGCNGTPIEGYQLRIVDEHDHEVPVGEVGQLLVRHDQPWRQMVGYLSDPAATWEVWRNGWFHSGDSFRRDAQGHYYFVGRMRDYVKTRGQNVSLAEVESYVEQHPDVVECGCIGVPTELSSAAAGFEDENIKAFVVRAVLSSLTEQALLAFLEERLPRFMLPASIEFIAEIPKSEINKPLKQALRELARK